MWILGKIYQEMVVLIFMLKQIITYYESKSSITDSETILLFQSA